MPSMDYCVFENTLTDLSRCQEMLGDREPLSASEADAARHLIRLCRELAEFEPDEIREETPDDTED